LAKHSINKYLNINKKYENSNITGI
jgi:hypothetical protein